MTLATYTITVYLPHSVILLFLLGFIGTYIVWRVVTYIIKLLPFV